MRKTKIVCTIGPSAQSYDMLKKLAIAGMNVARLNFSHGTHDEHREKIKSIKKVREELNLPIAIMLDTKGPEVRIKQFENDCIYLDKGSEFTFTTEDVVGDKKKVAITYNKLPQEIKKGDVILADDGLLQFQVKNVDEANIYCIVENKGQLKNNKSLNFPDTNIQIPAITQKDVDDIILGIKEDIDFIAASFIRKVEDVLEIRKILEDNNAEYIQIISKIENREGVLNMDTILEVSDGIMVARGDLGVEISPEEVPLVQKELIKKCNGQGKPVITATQMLDSMIRNPRPTRAEVTDVANAIFDGTDAIMLSGETAAGKYPILSVETMVRIAIKTEDSPQYRERMTHIFSGDTSVTNVISHATCSTAEQLQAAAIITATSSGFTARMVSKFRPNSAIIAITNNQRVVRTLSLVWGVRCLKTKKFTNTDTLFDETILIAVNEGLLQLGDLVVISAGIPLGVKGTTNMIKVQTIGDIIYQGMGVGKLGVTGTARMLPAKDTSFKPGDIVVAYGVDKGIMEYVKQASGIITEEGGLTSQGVIAALQLNIPIIVGVDGVLDLIEDGETITLDPERGFIYKGKVTVL